MNNQDAEGNFGMVSNYIKNQKPDITVTNPNPVVSGDEATITSPVQLKTTLPIVGDKTVTIKNVVLTFKKETGRAFLFFPVPKWRLIQVQAPENAVDSISME